MMILDAGFLNSFLQSSTKSPARSIHFQSVFSTLMASSQSALSEDMNYLTKPSGQNILSVATIFNPQPFSRMCICTATTSLFNNNLVYKADPTHYKRTISPTAVWPPNQAPLTPPPTQTLWFCFVSGISVLVLSQRIRNISEHALRSQNV